MNLPLSQQDSPRSMMPPLQDSVVESFVQHCHRRTYPAKTTIIHAGDTSDVLFYLVSGSVAVLHEDDDGREIVLAYLNAGDFFGELALFDHVNKRSAWIRTRVQCEVAEMSYSKFRALAKQDTEILFKLSGQMAVRLRHTSQKVGDLAFLDVSGRIAGTLLELCKEPDAMTHPDGMQISVTRQELGRIVGCTREMAGRVLKSLEEQGLVSVAGKKIVVFGTR